MCVIRYKRLLAHVFYILFLTSCNNSERSEEVGGEQIMNYPVITLAPRAVTLQNVYPTTIEGQRNIEIRPKIDGYIEEIYVDEGAVVKKGQLLFKINAPQYEQEVRTAEAAIKIAEANVSSAQMQVNKVRPLVERNIISKYELEAAEYHLQSQHAELAQAQATLANAKINLNYTLIISPVNGVVETLPYKIGSLVTTNTPLALTTVSDISNIFAYFSVNEKQALELFHDTNGTIPSLLTNIPPVELLLPNGIKFSEKGTIDASSGSINTNTGSIRLRANFPNPQGRIRSGSSGVVVIPLTIESAIVLPQKATYEIQGSKFVYVINAENEAKSTAIRVMDNNDGQFYVVTEGLKSGDQVVLEGLPSLRDGAKIKPSPVSIDSVYNDIDPS